MGRTPGPGDEDYGFAPLATKQQLIDLAKVTLDNDLEILKTINKQNLALADLIEKQHNIIVALSAVVRDLEVKVDRLEGVM